MKKWEYLVKTFDSDDGTVHNNSETDPNWVHLNELGAEGWELVHITEWTIGVVTPKAVFKRPVPKPVTRM